jgi:hypothetical protein
MRLAAPPPDVRKGSAFPTDSEKFGLRPIAKRSLAMNWAGGGKAKPFRTSSGKATHICVRPVRDEMFMDLVFTNPTELH